MWWAAHAEMCEQAIQDRWCASCSDAVKHLIIGYRACPGTPPTQMAIPLQMESVPKQLVAAMWRV